MENLPITPQTIFDVLILQELLLDNALWQVHNCRLLNQIADFDTPQSLLTHYNGLSDDLQAANPLSFEVLKRLDECMDADLAAALIGVNKNDIRRAWQIKYVGRVVFFCESLKLAVRLHFSNTAKPTQAVYADSQDKAWQSEAGHWAVFGVVDILYKGKDGLISVADDCLDIAANPSYQALPSEHSLSVLSLINDHKGVFFWLNQAIETCVQNWSFDEL